MQAIIKCSSGVGITPRQQAGWSEISGFLVHGVMININVGRDDSCKQQLGVLRHSSWNATHTHGRPMWLAICTGWLGASGGGFADL